MSKNNPLVSVLMPVYNGEKYLNEAIDSILSQTYSDFEFIIVNDGSTDKTEEIILSYADDRIRYVKNEENIRLIRTLNKGIDLAKGKYIARMDADDISLPNRLEKQVTFMEENPRVGLLGSFYKSFKGGNTVQSTGNGTPFLSNEGLQFRLIFSSTIRHPTAFIKTDVLNQHKIYFHLDYLHAEEHKLWVEIAKYAEVAVISDPLVLVRFHEESVTANEEVKKIQAKTETRIRMEQIKELGVHVPSESELLLSQFLEYFRYTRNSFLERTTYFSKVEIQELFLLVEQIIMTNRKKKQWDKVILEKMFFGKLIDILLAHTHLGPFVFNYLLRVSRSQKISPQLKAKSFIKSVLHIKRPVQKYLYNNYL